MRKKIEKIFPRCFYSKIYSHIFSSLILLVSFFGLMVCPGRWWATKSKSVAGAPRESDRRGSRKFDKRTNINAVFILFIYWLPSSDNSGRLEFFSFFSSRDRRVLTTPNTKDTQKRVKKSQRNCVIWDEFLMPLFFVSTKFIHLWEFINFVLFHFVII